MVTSTSCPCRESIIARSLARSMAGLATFGRLTTNPSPHSIVAREKGGGHAQLTSYWDPTSDCSVSETFINVSRIAALRTTLERICSQYGVDS